MVLSQAPKKYQVVLTSEQQMRKELRVNVTVKDLQEAMKEYYKLLNCDENEKKIALHANDYSNNKGSSSKSN